MKGMTINFLIDGVQYNNCAVYPFNFVNVLDETLDYATITLERLRRENIEVLTDIQINLTSNGTQGEQTVSLDWIVANDACFETPVGSGLYRHDLSIIEVTKFGEGFISDTLSVTQSGGNVYTDNAKPVEPEES